MPSSRRAKTRSGTPSLRAPCARRFSPAKAAATAETAPRRSPRRMARASRAGAAIERRPDRAANARVSLVVFGGVTGRIRRLSKGAPDFEFGLDVADDLVGELAGAGG